MKKILALLFFFFFLKTTFSFSPEGEMNFINEEQENTTKYNSAQNTAKTYKSQSILASGKWVKLAATEKGIHKISYSDLTSLGITNPENVAFYSNGGYTLPFMNSESYPDDLTLLPVIHSKDKNGDNCVFFYSTGIVKWIWDPSSDMFLHEQNLYSDSVYFFVSSDAGKSPEPETYPAINETADTTILSYDALDYVEDEINNYLKSGREWYGNKILTSHTYSFSFPNAKQNGSAKIKLAALAHSNYYSNYLININNARMDTFKFIYSRTQPVHKTGIFQVSAQKEMKIGINYNYTEPGSESWLDYLTLNVESELKFSSDQLLFRNSKSQGYNVVNYVVSKTGSDPVIWDVTNPLNPVSLQITSNINSCSFSSDGNSIHEFVAFSPSSGEFPEPVFSRNIPNQDIHGMTAYDMIIVTHPLFTVQAEKLAEFHRQFDRLSVLVVTIDEVFNEFSSGLPDVSSIRNMARMFYERQTGTGTPFKYLLLFGDGSYDNRDFNNIKPNYIPTYQTPESLNEIRSAVSDDYFGLLEQNEGELTGTVDIGIGRIPCQNEYEAEIISDKIINYASSESMGDWRNSICFIADDEDANGYMFDSEKLIDTINNYYPGFFVDKIYLDSYQQISSSSGDEYPEATEALNNRVNTGTLILNYMGHANTQSLAHEKVLEIDDIKSWSNSNALPVFVTATCEFSRFDDDATSAGEEILLNPAGGGVALFSTTRKVFQDSNSKLSSNFFQALFSHDVEGEKIRLGDAIRIAKNNTGDFNMRNFSLLSDPALRLAFPKHKILTTSINGLDPTSSDISISALDKVTIKGIVTDYKGSKLTDFKGELQANIYDKEIIVTTLQNDGLPAFEYPIQNNVIYKGSSLIENGEFEFSFIVPKDISYSVGKGKIIYYASDTDVDANGATTDFFIGGSSSNPITDNSPPEIELFMNNENFEEYDKVSSSALLLVNLFDESGINTVGAGIGHDLTAILDDDYSSPMILNDYYSSILGSYQNGKIIFPLTDLEPGEHKIRVKIWDVQNNSSEEEIYFIVEESFKITEVKTFPTQAVSYTDFEISHNLPGEIFTVNIDVFTLSGQKVQNLNETMGSRGTTKIKVRWDIFNSDFLPYTSQILVYSVNMVNQEGLTATGAGKLFLNMKY
ncbi:MAG: type IX secretion system sortase PorU [Prolixibacteraceae bacterium]|nr:type IX secretion system sortase PorU [Prolixibacteraceae bacterium]